MARRYAVHFIINVNIERYFHLCAGNTIILTPYCPGNPNQQWERENQFIRNRAMPNKVLDVASECCIV